MQPHHEACFYWKRAFHKILLRSMGLVFMIADANLRKIIHSFQKDVNEKRFQFFSLSDLQTLLIFFGMLYF